MSALKVTKSNHLPGTGDERFKVFSKQFNELVDYVNDTVGTPGTLEADTISEETVAAGVTVDGVLLKDGLVKPGNGTVSLPAYTFASDVDSGVYRIGANNIGVAVNATKIVDVATTGVTVVGSIASGAGTVTAPGSVVGANDNGFYEVSSTQLGVSVGNTLVGGFNSAGVFTNVIAEQTSTLGVTVDGALIKDGGVSNSAETILAGFYPIGAQQALSGPGAVNLTSHFTDFTSTATGNALTLANGSQKGQLKQITYIAEAAGGDTGVLTLTGYTSITFNAVTDEVALIWTGAAWIAIGAYGVTIV